MTERRQDAGVAARFGRAASRSDDAATVQRDICVQLASLCAAHAPADGPLLDAGCGTGFGLDHLARHHPGRTSVGIDIAPAMLECLRGRHPAAACAAANVEALPLATACVGGIWSSLCLQWCNPERAFHEFARVLRPGGVVWLATLGPRTFAELRHAFAGIDTARHVLDCPAPERLLGAATSAGLRCEAEARHLQLAGAQDLPELLRDVKAVGAHGVGAGRRRGLLGRQAWRAVQARYEAFRQADGSVTISYDALLLVLRKPF